jgi:hypothetical protein
MKATRRDLRVSMAALLVATGLCGAQVPDSAKTTRLRADTAHVDSLFHGHGFDGTGGFHLGVPAILSISPGAKLWLGDAIPGAIYVSAEPGLLDFRYGGGYQVFDQRLYGLGWAVRGGQLLTWANAFGATRAVTYSGVEVAASWALALTLRGGAYSGHAKDGRSVLLGTFDFGIGF